MTIASTDLAAALTDVRKAYRVAHAYQRRLWDLLRTVNDELSTRRLQFTRWRTQGLDPVPNARTAFFEERWAWDFLPAYNIACEWQRFDRARNITHRPNLIFTADTGYPLAPSLEPHGVHLEPVEQSKSEVQVGLWTVTGDTPQWRKAFEEHFKNARDGKTHALTLDGSTYTYRYLRIDMAELTDDEAIIGKLVTPITSWLDASGGLPAAILE